MYKSSIDIFTVSQERNHLESVGKMKDFVANKLRYQIPDKHTIVDIFSLK
jgi:hypothetical protein